MPNQESKKSYKFFAPKVFIRTFGCQMNVRDSEAIVGLMQDCGYRLTDNPEEADVVLINTCSVRRHAEERALSFLGHLKKIEQSIVYSQQSIDKNKKTINCGLSTMDYSLREKPIVGVLGCMAQNYKEELFKKLPHLDFIAGPSEISRIPKIIESLREKKQKIAAVDLEKLRPKRLYLSSYTENKKHAYVNISEGCDNYCSYCVVPYVRGSLRHRKAENIIREIKKLVALGIRDVTLLGQNVNSYKSQATGHRPQAKKVKAKSLELEAWSLKPISFVELLKMVNDVEGLENFSFVTSHPKDASIELFYAVQDLPKLKKYLHLPVQSGSDRILKLMNRGYTARHYRDLVQKYREIVKGGGLTTDIIVGFPTEKERDFADTLNLIKDIRFNSAYIFKYSPRPKTKAQEMPDDVAKEIKEKRHQILLDMQREISRKKNRE